MMAAIRSKDTGLEMIVRRHLHGMGLRYRLHAKTIPGHADLWFPSRRAAVFLHGCFFHGHDCTFFRLPATRPEFWRSKIEGNRARDHSVQLALDAAGIRTLTVWECTFRDRRAVLSKAKALAAIARWVISSRRHAVLSAKGFCHETRVSL
jgi:DNA mismatch endonuclease (patch repair protein)